MTFPHDEWRPAPQRPDAFGITLLPREAFAFHPGDRALRVSTGETVTVLMVQMAQGTERPYIVAADAAHAEQHAVSAAELVPATREEVRTQVRRRLRALTRRGRPGEHAALRVELEALEASMRLTEAQP